MTQSRKDVRAALEVDLLHYAADEIERLRSLGYRAEADAAEQIVAEEGWRGRAGLFPRCGVDLVEYVHRCGEQFGPDEAAALWNSTQVKELAERLAARRAHA